MSPARVLIALLSALMMAGCASLPLQSAIALRRVDFQTTDFAKLRVAVQFPEFIRAQAEGVKMIATVTYDGEAPRKESFTLREATLEGVAPPTAPRGSYVRTYGLRASDSARMDAIRKEIVAARAEGRRGSFGIGVEANEFCRAGEIGGGAVMITTYLKAAETPEFVPLLRNFDLRSDDRTAQALTNLAPC
jgi:hypothetical protein